MMEEEERIWMGMGLIYFFFVGFKMYIFFFDMCEICGWWKIMIYISWYIICVYFVCMYWYEFGEFIRIEYELVFL